MSAEAAIVPATEVRSPRASVGRIVVVAAAYMAIVIAAAIYPLISPLGDIWNAPVSSVEKADDVLSGLLWLAILLVSIVRQPDGRLWKLIFLALATQRVEALEYVPNSVVWSVARVAERVGVGVFVQLLLSFPTGHLRDRFDRLVVGLAYVLSAAWALDEFLFVGDWFHLACDPDCVQNVFVVWPDSDLHDWLRNVIVSAFCLFVIPLVIVGLWRHWRAAAAAARRTLLPLVVGVPLWLVVAMFEVLSRELDIEPGIAFFDSPPGRVIHLIAPLVFPVGLLLGMLRARWSRGRIANLVVEIGRGVPVGGLRYILARALGDPSLQLAFAAPTGSGFVDASGQPIELPVADPSRTITRLEREGELLGILVHDPAIEAEDPGLVEAVGNAARLALENERLAAEVRAQLEEVRGSRARIVEAADVERRRVERDLHDGAQQRLVALAMRLQVAKAGMPGASALLDEATAELETAIGEVRGLARGVHPTILTEAGLRAAVDALAERTPVPIMVDIGDRRFNPQIEGTAYFVVAEALTNVARYAAASVASVSAVEDDGRLVVTVADDGRGGADPSAGSGLRGLSDRVAAVDGRLTISSPSGGGTVIRAELPLEAPVRTTAHVQMAAPSSALASVRAVPAGGAVPRPQGHGRLSSPVVLMSGVAASIAIVALVAALAGMQPRAADNGRADTFVRPFVYQVPGGSGIALDAKSDHLQVLRSSDGWGGISIWAVEDVLQDHCSYGPESTVVPRQPGVEGLLSYIRSVDGVHVEDIGRTVVDGKPASRVDLWMESVTLSGCRDPHSIGPSSIHLWRDALGTVIQIPPQGHVPLTLLDVDGETIAIEIWAGGDRVGDWLPTAYPIVASIRFLYRPPIETSPVSPTGLR
jgi:signal transduction histidine kinase